MLTSVEATTESGAAAEMMAPTWIVMFAEPIVFPSASPVAGSIVATLEASEAQAPDVVRFCVEPSEYVPVAVNCCVIPFAMVAAPGVMAILTNEEFVTLKMAGGETTAPIWAVMFAEPAATPNADPEEELIVATPSVSEAHDAELVTFCVEPSV